MDRTVKHRLSALIIFLLSCFCCVYPVSAEEIIDRIAAVVNNEVITLSDLNKVTALMLASAGQQRDAKEAFTEEQRAEIAKKALEQLIERKLIEQKAKEFGIKADAKDVSRAVEDVLKKNNLTIEQLREILKKEGTTLEEYQKMLKSEILQSKVIGREVRSRITITEKDVQDYYEKNVKAKDKPGEKIRIQQIFIPVPPISAPAQVEKLTKHLEQIRAKIVSGEDFGQAAAKYSQDPASQEGGDLGYFHRGELLPALEQEAFSMKPGEVSPIIRTSVGLHIIKVVDKQGSGGSEVQGWQGKKEEIEDGLYRQEVENLYQKWMEDLKKKAYIKSYL